MGEYSTPSGNRKSKREGKSMNSTGQVGLVTLLFATVGLVCLSITKPKIPPVRDFAKALELQNRLNTQMGTTRKYRLSTKCLSGKPLGEEEALPENWTTVNCDLLISKITDFFGIVIQLEEAEIKADRLTQKMKIYTGWAIRENDKHTWKCTQQVLLRKS
jgi:hypothetical protein